MPARAVHGVILKIAELPLLWAFVFIIPLALFFFVARRRATSLAWWEERSLQLGAIVLLTAYAGAGLSYLRSPVFNDHVEPRARVSFHRVGRRPRARALFPASRLLESIRAAAHISGRGCAPRRWQAHP